MILVTGATGHLGKLTIDFLLKKQSSDTIAALVRDTAKAKDLTVQLRKGDYFDYPAMVAAFKGVDTLVLVSSGSLEDRLTQHNNAINAAKESGVKHIVYTSMMNTSEKSKFTAGIDHLHTEASLKKSGIPYTVLRNTFYAEVVTMLAGDALTSGNWYFAGGTAKANFASRKDMAEALANVAADPSAHKDKIYEIASGKTYSLAEVAGFISKITGKPFTYTAISQEDQAAGMKQAGVPEVVIGLIGSIAETISSGELDLVYPALEDLLKRKPLGLEEALTEILK
jgi:NAD(P)H dehydrogenase (quinone)